MSFYLGSWGMNQSKEQTNRLINVSRFTRFVCPALRFIPHEPRKKDTHSLIIHENFTYNLIINKAYFYIDLQFHINKNSLCCHESATA